MSIASDWSDLPESSPPIARRDLLVLSAAAVAALFVAADPHLRDTITPSPVVTPMETVRSFRKYRWDWTVELAVLHRLDADRAGALALLSAALELDLDPTQTWRHKPALRLYDLFAALSDAPGRAALATLVASRSAHPALLARASLWSDASRAQGPRLWRTVGPDRRPLGIYLARA